MRNADKKSKGKIQLSKDGDVYYLTVSYKGKLMQIELKDDWYTWAVETWGKS